MSSASVSFVSFNLSPSTPLCSTDGSASHRRLPSTKPCMASNCASICLTLSSCSFSRHCCSCSRSAARRRVCSSCRRCSSSRRCRSSISILSISATPLDPVSSNIGPLVSSFTPLDVALHSLPLLVNNIQSAPCLRGSQSDCFQRIPSLPPNVRPPEIVHQSLLSQFRSTS